MKKICSIFLTLVFLLSFFSTNTLSQDLSTPDIANELYNIGLLKGTDKGFQLEKDFTETEAAVMLVRILGKENEILNNSNTTTGSIKNVPQWALPYFAYLQNNNLISINELNELENNSSIDSVSYLDLMLKSLGYVEDKDFNTGNIIDFSKKIGLINAESSIKKPSESFKREDAFYITYNTLTTKLANSDEVMIHKLASENYTIRMGLKEFADGKYYDKNLFSNTENELIGLWNEQTVNASNKSHYDSSTQPVIFFGDSLTEGLTMVDSYDGYNILNKGVNGNTVEQMFERLYTDVLQYKPKTIFIMAGTNNLWEGNDIDSVVATYEKILITIKKFLPDCKVYVQQNIPFGSSALERNSGLSVEKLEKYNVKVQQIALKHGYEYLFIGNLYKDNNGLLNSQYTNDGIHLKLDYYYMWIKEIKSRITN